MIGCLQIFCGFDSEEDKKSNGFRSIDDSDDNGGGTENNGYGNKFRRFMRKRSSGESKASLALRLKRQNSIFSSPLDLDEALNYQCRCHPKTDEEAEFIRKAFQNHILFEELTQGELEELVQAAEKVQAEPGTKVVKQDENGESLFLIQTGKVTLFCEHARTAMGTLQDGELYGQIRLLYGQTAPHSVIADQPSTLWKLSQHTFRHIRAKHTLRSDANIKASLRKVDLFKTLPEQTINKFADTLTRVTFLPGERIVSKGEMGQVFYIIEKGTCRVHDIGIGDSQPVDILLKEGDSFGERSLLTGEPRAAHVTAVTDVTTLAMDRGTFQENIGQLKDVLDFPSKVQAIKGLPIFADTDITGLEFDRIAELTSEVCYRKGTKLFEAGQPYPPCCWMIRSGQVLVYGTKSTHIYNFRSGDYFGDKSIMNPEEHTSSHDATCESNVDAWVLTRDDIESVIVDLHRLGKTAGFVKAKGETKLGINELKKHKVLGQGAFGKVWLVQSKNTDTPYAMKIINKRKLLDSKQERGVLREKEMLALLHHPFILYLVSSFQDEKNLYLVLPLIQGGELFHVLSQESADGHGLSVSDAAFYGAGIVEALGHFHHRYIAYRDLKLENVMIDSEGYIKIVDLGFAKVILDKSYTFCGTPDYLAPEVIMAKGHYYPVDYWAFGVLLFELLAGRSPFSKPNQEQLKMFKRIVLMDYRFPAKMDNNGKDLIDKLLQRNVPSRLGVFKNGYLDIRNHLFFKEAGVDAKKLLKKEMTPPWKPKVTSPLDSQNFDDFSKSERESSYGGRRLSEADQALFADF